MTQRRAAIYLRQSRYHDGSISEAMQESTCRALCEQKGWTVVGVHRDIDISGTSIERRDGLRALRKSYDAGEFDVAVAHAASRFARNMADGADIVAEMPIATVLEGEAPPDDDFMPLLHMLLAHKQAREIGKRWKEAHAYLRMQGKPSNAGPRFGYVYKDKAYTLDPKTGPVLRECYLRYTRGEGWLSIVTDLNERGYRTTKGAEWRTTVLRRVLDSGFGAGLIVHHETEFLPGAHEPVITPQEWDAYQAARKRRSKFAPRAQTPTWHLSRIAVCAECGKPLMISGTSKDTKAGRKQYRYATCSRAGNSGTCSNKYRYKKERIEKQVAIWLGGHVKDWAAALPDNSIERAEAEARLQAARDTLAALDARLGRLATGWADGVLDDAGYREARAQADEEKAVAVAAEDEAREALDAFLPADVNVYDRLVAAPDMTTGEFNDLLRRIIKRIEVSAAGLTVVTHAGAETFLPNPGREVPRKE